MAEYVYEVWNRCTEYGAFTDYKRRERIVRCCDCEHASPCPLADSERLMCTFRDEMLVGPDDFCVWGEERDS